MSIANYKIFPKMEIMGNLGSKLNLDSVLGKKTVLYFYPKDDTPGCTLESNAFNLLLDQFKQNNCSVYGISRDDLKSHDKFCQKYGLKFELLSDVDEKYCKYFDVIKEKNMYGKISMGIERSTFIFSEMGELIKEYRKVKADGHAEEVLAFIKSVN